MYFDYLIDKNIILILYIYIKLENSIYKNSKKNLDYSF